MTILMTEMVIYIKELCTCRQCHINGLLIKVKDSEEIRNYVRLR